VRYNPEGDKDMNARQTPRLRQLSSICTTPIASICSSCSCRRRQSNCNRSMRPQALRSRAGARLMVRAIRELQEAGVEPDIWKIEGLDRREDCVQVVKPPVEMDATT